MAGEVFVNFDHGTAKILAVTAHGEFGAGIGRPLREGAGELLVIPGEKKVGQFVVVHRIGVGGVGHPEVAGLAKVTGIFADNIEGAKALSKVQSVQSS